MLSGGDISRNQPRGLADLCGLGASLGAELIEQAAGVGLHRVFTHEEPLGNLAIAEAGGDESQNLQFTRRDTKLAHTCLVNDERAGGLHWDLLDDRFPD